MIEDAFQGFNPMDDQEFMDCPLARQIIW